MSALEGFVLGLICGAAFGLLAVVAVWGLVR